MAQGQEVDRLFVGLGLDAKQFDQALKASTQKLNDWGQSMQQTGQTLTQSLTAPISGAVGALGVLTERTSKYAEEVELAAAQSGVGAEKIQELAFAAKTVSGAEFDSVRDGLKELALRSAEAAEGTGEAVEAFDRLGISQEALQSMSTAETFERVRQEMQGLTKQQRVLTAEQVLGGEAGEKFAEVLALNSEEMGRLREEAQSSGAVLGGEQVGALDALRTEYNGLLAELKGVGRQLAVSLVPIIRSAVVPAMESLVDGVRSAIQWFGDLSTTTKTWIGIIGGTAAAIGPALVALGTLSTLLSGLPAALSAIGTTATAAWAAITGPVGLVVAAVASVAAGAFTVINYWEEVSSFFSDLFSGLVTMAEGFKQGFLGVWKKVAGEVSQVILDLVRRIVGGLQSALNAVGVDRFDSTFSTVISKMKRGIQASTQAANQGSQMMTEAWDKMGQGAVEFGNDVAQVAGDVKTSIMEMVTFTSAETEGMFDIGQAGAGGGGAGGGGSGGGGSGAGQDSGGQGFTMEFLKSDTFKHWQKQINEALTQTKTQWVEWSRVGDQALNSVSRGLGRIVSGLVEGRSEIDSWGDAFREVGRVIQRVLARVLQKVIQTVIQTALLKAITSAFTGGGGAAFTGVVSPGISGAGILSNAGPSQGSMQVKQAGTPAVQGGEIRIPVTTVTEANRQGKRQKRRIQG